MTSRSDKSEWKETTENLYGRKESKGTSENKIKFYNRENEPKRYRVKDLSFAQRHSKLVHGVIVSSALLLFFSKTIYDSYVQLTEPSKPDLKFEHKTKSGV
uniref:Uncharacterized protein n=1 Tax=Graphocephala atropunctata TaxID=36148 RepID=A0A1B6LU94_9HEMI